MTRRTSRYRDLHTIKPLIYIGNATGLMPPYDFRNEKRIQSRLYLVYVVFVIVVHAAFGTMASYYRIRDVYAALKPTIVVVDLIANVLVTVSFVVVIAKLVLFKSRDSDELLRSIVVYNRKINVAACKASGRNHFRAEMCAYHLLYVAYVIADAYVWVGTLGFATFRHYLFRDVQYYYTLTLCFLMHNVALIIRDRFEQLNVKLECDVTLATRIAAIAEVGAARRAAGGVRPWKQWQGVKEAMGLYLALCEIVVGFNRVYGSVIVLMSMNFIVGLLQPINIGLVYATSKEDLDGNTYGSELAVLCFLWASIYVICGWSIASSCDDVTDRGKETSFLCYKLINDLNNCSDHRHIKEDLVLLANLIDSHPPTFEAAGFFTVNFKTLVSILGSVTAYIVVLIQFKN